MYASTTHSISISFLPEGLHYILGQVFDKLSSTTTEKKTSKWIVVQVSQVVNHRHFQNGSQFQSHA